MLRIRNILVSWIRIRKKYADPRIRFQVKDRLLQGMHGDFDHAMLQVAPLQGTGGRAGSGLNLPVGSDTTVGGLGYLKWGFLQISFLYILV